MSWQIYTVISVLALSISVILQRTLIHKDKTDPFAYAVVFQGIVGILLMIFALSYGFKLPGIGAVIVPAIISVVFFGVGHIMYAKTLQRVEASAFSVLFATQAIWIMLLGVVLFNESLTAVQILGTILIFFGVGLLIKNIRTVFRDKGALLGLLTGLLFGIAITAWSYVGRHTDGLSWAAISFVGTSLVAFLVRPKSVQKMKPLLKVNVLSKLILLAIFYAIGSVAMLFAYKEGSLTVVSPLRQTSIIVTVLLALAFLPNERNRIQRKILAALICAAGVILIVV
jgi:drug/metabolite transporter (DMT)-like permease